MGFTCAESYCNRQHKWVENIFIQYERLSVYHPSLCLWSFWGFWSDCIEGKPKRAFKTKETTFSPKWYHLWPPASDVEGSRTSNKFLESRCRITIKFVDILYLMNYLVHSYLNHMISFKYSTIFLIDLLEFLNKNTIYV